MSAKQSFRSNSTDFHQNSAYLERPRLRKLLKAGMDYPMITVCAGAGYGKTRTVYRFLQKYDAHTIWIQLSERDNQEARFWEKYVNLISLIWPEIGSRLLEIGFPESDEAFAEYEDIQSELIHQEDFVLVYDDFHILQNPKILHFFEKTSSNLPTNGTMILLSRTMPEMKMSGMALRERIFTIHEDSLCFTEEEIAAYFAQLELSIPRQDIRYIYDDTQGWAFAINLIGRSLSKDTKYERYSLEAMKMNVFQLIETEMSKTVSKPLYRFLIRLSLIDTYPASLVRALANNNDKLIEEMASFNAYIRYEYYRGAYMIQKLFLDYLRQFQFRLTDDEKQETYDVTGRWCENNGYQTEALSYYEKAGNYDAIMRIVYSLSAQAPKDIAAYVLEIFGRIPEDVASQNPLFPAMDLKMKMSLGMLDESCALAEKYAKDYEARPETPERDRALAEIYGFWANIRMFMCPCTDAYDFDKYFEKQRMYYDKNPYIACGPSSRQQVGAYALLIGTNRAHAPKEYIDALSRSIPHASHVLDGNMCGIDDLAQGELYYCQRDMNNAEQYLIQALDKSKMKGQYDIQSRAMLYLMLISLSRGDIKGATDILKQMKALLDVKEYMARYESYDIARAYYHLALKQPGQVPDWLKSDFSTYAHPAFVENHANRVKAQYCYLTKQYNVLLAFLENIWESQTLLVGKIAYRVLEALSLYQLKRREEAVASLTEAYLLAEPNDIIVPFTQYSKDMRTLTAAALKDPKCEIPADWLENINRKSSAFSKRQAHMLSGYREANNIADEITLTKREAEVLKDLSQGLSRAEIATSQNLSINTVKMVINIIYEKLNVRGLPDAIRIAIDRKII